MVQKVRDMGPSLRGGGGVKIECTDRVRLVFGRVHDVHGVSIRILMWINFVLYFAMKLHKQSEKNEIWKKN